MDSGCHIVLWDERLFGKYKTTYSKAPQLLDAKTRMLSKYVEVVSKQKNKSLKKCWFHIPYNESQNQYCYNFSFHLDHLESIFILLSFQKWCNSYQYKCQIFFQRLNYQTSHISFLKMCRTLTASNWIWILVWLKGMNFQLCNILQSITHVLSRFYSISNPTLYCSRPFLW